MWCKQCNIETNASICPVCGETTEDDLPVEVYWCDCCKTPVINTVVQADKGYCPICGNKTKYLSADLRPVFPEERLLVELILGKEPNVFKNKSVWASNNRYYINGESIAISNGIYSKVDIDAIIEKLNRYEIRICDDTIRRSSDERDRKNRERGGYEAKAERADTERRNLTLLDDKNKRIEIYKAYAERIYAELQAVYSQSEADIRARLESTINEILKCT